MTLATHLKPEMERRTAHARQVLASGEVGPRELHRQIGGSYGAAQKLWHRLTQAEPVTYAKRDAEIEVPPQPSASLPTAELIAQRRRVFELKAAAHEARKLTPVNVRIEGPIGITWFGDPHLDDDGCNFPQLQDDVETVKATRAMYAANIGDTNNNWIGRLKALWEHQSTTGAEAWKLVEWFVKELPWLVFIKGNHGAWSGSNDPLDWMLRDLPTMTEDMEARFELRFPNGTTSRIFARHDFPGHSQWNVTHGMAKAATLAGFDDTILVAGHKHTTGYQVVMNANSGVISHLVRASGYKAIDKYAKDNFFTDHTFAESVVTVLDPAFPPTDPRHCTVFFDVQQGAEYLTWLRAKGGFR